MTLVINNDSKYLNYCHKDHHLSPAPHLLDTSFITKIWYKTPTVHCQNWYKPEITLSKMIQKLTFHCQVWSNLLLSNMIQNLILKINNTLHLAVKIDSSPNITLSKWYKTSITLSKWYKNWNYTVEFDTKPNIQ